MDTIQLQKEDKQKMKTVISKKSFNLVDHSDIEKGLFALYFDMPNEKVNKLNWETLGELQEILDTIKDNSDIKALVFLSKKENIFIAGADINIIQSIHTKEEGEKLAFEGQKILQRLENFKFPVIAAINGASMGGGTELSLCCKYIVVSDSPSTKIGLPEVNLGVLPGFGGCIRLPERIGLQAAMDFILTGKTMDAKKALKLGFADAVFPYQLFTQKALEFGANVIKGQVPSKKLNKDFQAKLTESILEKNPVGRMILFSKAKEMIMKKTRGHYPAPLKIIEVLSKTYGKSRKEALLIESKAFGELAITDVSKRLIELFFATEKVKKLSGVDGKKLEEKDKIHLVGLLGAGVMGGGIALLCASKNYPVRMKDINYQALALGTNAAQRIFADYVKKKKMTKREADIKFALISPTIDYTGFEAVDVVIEAVVENMEIKKKVLQEVEAVMKPNAIFATNTSSLSITEMAKVSKNPENVVGMHFFNPVHKMPLIEVIRAEKTSDRAVMAIYDLAKKLGKTPIVVKDGPGFLVNRLLMPYLNEASYIMAEGAPIKELDECVLDFGLPMGPATLLDEIGIDVAVKVAHILHEAFGVRAQPCDLNEKLVQAKLFGKKTKIGFYEYDEKGKQGELNKNIYNILGVTPRTPSKKEKEDWIPRMTYLMINEAALCLEEGITYNPMDVDIGMIFGTGFPPFRGGLLRYADSEGIRKIVDKLEEFSKKYGERFTPVEPLVKMARTNQKFYKD